MDELEAYWRLERYRVTPVDLIEIDEAVLRRRRGRMPAWGPGFSGVPELAPCPFRDRLDAFVAGGPPALLVRGLGEKGVREVRADAGGVGVESMGAGSMAVGSVGVGGVDEDGGGRGSVGDAADDLLEVVGARLGVSGGEAEMAFEVVLCPPGGRDFGVGLTLSGEETVPVRLSAGELLVVRSAGAEVSPLPPTGDGLYLRLAAR
ncbi:hypothetical protein [Actinocorallia longicatena]